MKIKQYLSALAAVFTLGLTVSCNEDFEPTYNNALRVSQSYLPISTDGGNAIMEIKASESWTIEAEITVKDTLYEYLDTTYVLNRNKCKVVTDEDGNNTYLLDNDGNKIIQTVTTKYKTKDVTKFVTPSDEEWPYAWLDIDVASGEAGTAKVTFSADADNSGRTAALVVRSGSNVQNVNIIQGLATVSKAKVKDVMSGPETTYRVTGTVTKISETATYGNFYINDGTSDTDLYIYGTLYEGQTKQGALVKLGLEVGDVVTVEGPKTVYNGTVELVDVTVVELVKSLIKIKGASIEGAASHNAGEVAIELECKGDGVELELPENAKSWVSIKSVTPTKVVLALEENTATAREATIKFTTNGGEYSAEYVLGQEGYIGSLERPMTVEEAIAAATAGTTGAVPVYIHGVVARLQSGGFKTQYTNGSFWISEDGTNYNDKTKEFEAYQVYWLNGQSWADSMFPQIAVGDEVVLCAPLTYYKGTSETQAGLGYIHSIIEKGE